MSVRVCVGGGGKSIHLGPLARIMVLNDSDDVDDLFILHPWNLNGSINPPLTLTLTYPQFLLYGAPHPRPRGPVTK